MSLKDYQQKRDFSRTPEPTDGKEPVKSSPLIFVCQEHYATHHHFDFRLQSSDPLAPVLISWAVPKGPCLDPGVKRLAMRVEDHPKDYSGFEGEIPPGEYGAGTVSIWDKGSYQMEDFTTIEEGLAQGAFSFTLFGEKMNGRWRLVKMQGENWLLIKGKD
jgi:bifunctional non-homologous end joining protein LigD